MAEISAARINNLHERIKLVLGNGTGNSGYGQQVASSAVNNQTGFIQAADINNIYADMVTARVHQVGPNNAGIAEVIQNLNVVAETNSYLVSDAGVVTSDPDGLLKGIKAFESVMNDIEADKFIMHPSQAVVEQAISSVRQTVWNGILTHEFKVTFNNADHRRHFFNTGGEIRFSATNVGANTPKGLDWTELFSEVGTVSFSHNKTVSLADSQLTNLGNYQLTGSYQTVYQKVGRGTYAGVYAGNLYTIKARVDTAVENILWFRIEMNDIASDNRIDNNVTGRIESIVQQYRADANGVTVASPSYFNVSNL